MYKNYNIRQSYNIAILKDPFSNGWACDLTFFLEFEAERVSSCWVSRHAEKIYLRKKKVRVTQVKQQFDDQYDC